MCSLNAYSEALKTFKTSDPFEMAKNAGGEYYEKGQTIKIKYLGAKAAVDFLSGEIVWEAPAGLMKNDKVLILQYLTSACGVTPRGTWVSFIQLPDGPHHHAPFVLEAMTPLAREFGDRVDEFKRRAAVFGAEEIQMGDYGVVIPVFPHLPLAVCLWKGDAEFAANSNILFDVTAPLHLTTAALWVLGVEVSRRLRGIQGQQYS